MFIMGWQGLCFMPLKVICERERGLWCVLHWQLCPGLEVTHVTSIYNSVTRTTSVASPPPLCPQKGQEAQSYHVPATQGAGKHGKLHWLLRKYHNGLLKSLSLPSLHNILSLFFTFAFLPAFLHATIHLPISCLVSTCPVPAMALSIWRWKGSLEKFLVLTGVVQNLSNFFRL